MKGIKSESVTIHPSIHLVSRFHTEMWEILQALLNLGLYVYNPCANFGLLEEKYFLVNFREDLRVHEHLNNCHSSGAW